MPRLAGLAAPPRGGQSFAPALGPAIGNDVPANTGLWEPAYAQPGPGPMSAEPAGPSGRRAGGPGYRPGGQQSGNDGVAGTDPRKPLIPLHRSILQPGWQECLGGPDAPGGIGVTGFNDQRRVVDRHAFWDTGNQVTGLSFTEAGAHANTYNNPEQQPPVPVLRTVNRSVTWQLGADASRNADDLSRPYTRNAQGMYVGEQGSGWSPVYGGTPGLYEPYGSRGGWAAPIQAPVPLGANGDGPQKVWAGPPHGLHSLTTPDRAMTLSRYGAAPQQRPVRLDRPSNSPQAGQSYSQTVQMQGQAARAAPKTGSTSRVTGRGWKGSS